jgi:Na+-translocating ferredoxin:NAD+ oxidoreductase RnfG subunit
MKNKLMPSIVLCSICLIVALLLAAVNTLTAPIIEQEQAEKVQQSLALVLPTGKNFIEIETNGLPHVITSAFTEDGGGYVFQMNVTGYKSGLVILCGINADGSVAGAEYISSSETLSAEVGLGEKYVGQTGSSFTPELISGATKTTSAYADAVKAALDAYAILTETEDSQ